MRPAPDSRPEGTKAQVTLAIATSTRPIYLTGIVVQQQRPGWNTLDLPPLEQWEEPMRWLTPAQRERFETPEFYRMLEDQIGRRFAVLARRNE